MAGFLPGPGVKTVVDASGIGIATEATLQQVKQSTASLDSKISGDIFGNLVVGQRDNQIEVHFDDVNWATYLTLTTSGGGGSTQLRGHVHFTTGTAATAQSKAVTIDTIKYRPEHEASGGFTACWPQGGVVNSYSRIGPYNDVDGFFVGYEGATFQATWRRNSVDTPIPRSSWSDQLTGAAGSHFTRAGVPEAINFTKTNIFRIRYGWFGSATILFEVFAPDGVWVEFYRIRQPNNDPEASLTNPDLPITVDVKKTGADATNIEIDTGCWAGGTTSNKQRISDPISDRSLAQVVHAVITGKTTGGGGGYVDVKVNPSGALAVDATSNGANIATEATLATRLADATFTGRINTLGQKTMAGSTPVVIASDQSAVPISASSLPLPTGAATDAGLASIFARQADGTQKTQVSAALPTGANTIGKVDQGAGGASAWAVSVASLPLPTGAATESTLSAAKTDLDNRNNAFATLINALPNTTAQEIRMDDIAGGDLYLGRNADNAATSAATWEVVRIYRTATGATTRIRYRTGVVWDNRTAGWT